MTRDVAFNKLQSILNGLTDNQYRAFLRLKYKSDLLLSIENMIDMARSVTKRRSVQHALTDLLVDYTYADSIKLVVNQSAPYEYTKRVTGHLKVV